ncbi:MAG: NarK/NasA family nitrate transporter [Chitinophagaceae bacterium]|nr:NarK/NasA family nitrate transporter [Chitinophagaceae bacterium]
MESKGNGISNRILFLTTLTFTICFAAWMINGVLVTFLVNNNIFKWSSIEIGWLMGVPVLVGSLLRLPIGMLTDKYGGRWVMTIILFLTAVPMFFLSTANSYNSFLLLSFGFGISGSAFAAGVAFTSLWFPKERQGTALGIFGAGNIGAAITTMLAPKLLNVFTDYGAHLDGWRNLPKVYGVVLIVMGVIFWLGSKNKKPSEIKTFRQRLAPLKESRVWRFGLYYFVVFGSFVALTQWLIPYYVNVYSMSIVMAGFMTTAFNLPSGIIRILGGIISDKAGARIVLYWVFGICITCLILLLPPRIEIRTPGQGIIAPYAGTAEMVSDSMIVIRSGPGDADKVNFALQGKRTGDKGVNIRFGIHHDEEGFLLLPTTISWQEPLIKENDEIAKGQLIARGITEVYFQANKWIFSALVFIIGIMLGIGSAAVFKHISVYYPQDVGTVGGIVGVLGGLGGFMDPIIFGYLLTKTGVWTSCWAFLAVVSLISLVLMRFAIKKQEIVNPPTVS